MNHVGGLSYGLLSSILARYDESSSMRAHRPLNGLDRFDFVGILTTAYALRHAYYALAYYREKTDKALRLWMALELSS